MRTPLKFLMVILLFGLSFAGLTAQQPPPPPPPETHQFDFWIGEWEVTQPNGTAAGTNKIEAINGGRALLENWTSAAGNFGGKSLNSYDAVTGKWKQFWVDTSGLVLEISGGFEDGKMVMSGTRKTPQGAEVQDRITWTPNPDGSVRQQWDSSTDGGATWQPSFDGTYRKKE